MIGVAKHISSFFHCIAFAGMAVVPPATWGADHSSISTPTPGLNRVLDAWDLMKFVDHDGSVKEVNTREDWQRRRQTILEGMDSVMGSNPHPPLSSSIPPSKATSPLVWEVEESLTLDHYVRQRIRYEADPGDWVPAYLLIPRKCLEGGEQAFGVMCLHQTHAQGNRTVVGLGESPNDEYGVELVKRGWVCLAPSYPLLANYSPDLKGLGYESGTLKGIWNHKRGLDLLEQLPYVRRGVFGTIGHSLGGHNSVFLGVTDPRIQVVVSSCGLDSFQDYMGGNIKGWTSSRYMPRLSHYQAAQIPFDFPELIGLIAPRWVFLSAPTGDTNFRWRSVQRIGQSAQDVYKWMGVKDRLRIVHPEAGHLFPQSIRLESYEFMENAVQEAWKHRNLNP